MKFNVERTAAHGIVGRIERQSVAYWGGMVVVGRMLAAQYLYLTNLPT
jgi:hypothetical protein